MKKVRVMLAVILTFSLAVCACLAAALGAGAAADLRPGDPAAESADPVESEYDVFSDPNVLWGTDEEADVGNCVISEPTVFITPKLNELMSAASEENLVAFRIGQFGNYGYLPIDMERLAIPDQLVGDANLIALIDAYNEAVARCDEESSLLRHEIRYYVEDAYREGAVATEEVYAFSHSWWLLEAEEVRARFVALGFAPVYELESIYREEAAAGKPLTVDEQIDRVEQVYDKILTFVGAPEDIRQFAEEVPTDEQYYFYYYAFCVVGQDSFDMPA